MEEFKDFEINLEDKKIELEINKVDEMVISSLSNNTKEKATILIVTDSPVVNTGFGRVCNELTSRWLKTGKYKIVCLGINDRGDFHPLRQTSPDLIIEPLPLIEQDPYGMQKFPEILRKYNPDLVIALNDIWVLTGDERNPNMDHWMYRQLKEYKPYVPWIVYFPVDGVPWDQKWVEATNQMDYAVTFTDWGKSQLLKTPGINPNKIKTIYHGHDTTHFFKISDEERMSIRKMMGLPNDDAFLIGSVNRNQPRKHIPALIEAFKYFNEGYVICNNCDKYRSLDVMDICEYCGSEDYREGRSGIDNSYLYLHMNAYDMRGYKIPSIQKNYKIKNLMMRPNHDIVNGVPIEDLNRLYNAMDVHVNTAISAGYELTSAEAQAAGTPSVGTRTTALMEVLGNGNGYLVNPSTVTILADANHAFKAFINVDRLTDTLFHIYENRDEAKQVAENGRKFAESRTWDVSASKFEELFDDCLKNRICLHDFLFADKQNVVFVNNTNNFGNVLSSIPALNKLAESNPSVNFIYAIRNRIMPMAQGISDKITVIDIGKMFIDSEKLNGYNLQINDIEQMAYHFENALTGIVDPKDIPSYIESYARKFNVQLDENSIKEMYEVDPLEYISIVEDLPEEKIKDKMKVAFLVNCSDPSYGINQDEWIKVINMSKKFKDICSVVIGMPNEIEPINADIKISNRTIRQLIAILSEMDCVVTSSDEYCHLANILDTQFLVIQGPKRFEHNLKHSIRPVKYLDQQRTYNCMPCMKNSMQPCMKTGNPIAHCMRTIYAGSILAKIIELRKNWINAKEIPTIKSD